MNLGTPCCFDISSWANRVQMIDAKYAGTWKLPAIGTITVPTVILVPPDGYVAYLGDLTQVGLTDSLTTWFGSPAVV